MSSSLKATMSRLLGADSTASTTAWMLPQAGALAQEEEAAAEEPDAPDADLPLCRDETHGQIMAAQQDRIQQLEREVESRPKQAYQRGYAEGSAAGAKEATAKLEPVFTNLAKSIESLANARRRHLIESEEDAVKLAVAVARRVLHREISVDPDSLLGIVKATVAKVDSRDVHRVRLNPEDIPALQRNLGALNLPEKLEVSADRTLDRGSVIVESSRGSLDASIATQLGEIERGLVDLVRRSS